MNAFDVWAPLDLNDDSTAPRYKGTTGINAQYPPPYYKVSDQWALRLAPGVIAIDVDHYGDKTGGDTLLDLEIDLGELPETYKVTSRGFHENGGKYLFRVPADWTGRDPGKDVDLIRHGHRYIQMGTHRKTGTEVEVFDQYGDMVAWGDVSPDDIPFLPDAWLKHLSSSTRARTAGIPDDAPGSGPNPVACPSAPANGIGSRTSSSDYPGGLLGYACDLRKAGAGTAWIAEHLESVARSDGDPWTEYDLEKIATEAVKKTPVDYAAYATGASLAPELQTYTSHVPEGEDPEDYGYEPAESGTVLDQVRGYYSDVPGIDTLLSDPDTLRRLKADMVSDLVKGKNRARSDIPTGTQLEGFQGEDLDELLRGEDASHDLAKFGNRCLMSRGSVGLLFGTSHTGKTTIMAAVTRQVVIAGGKAVWLVFDGTPSQVAKLLHFRMGLPRHLMENVVFKSMPPKPANADAAKRAAETWGADLVVIDNMNTVGRCWYPSLGENSNDLAPDLMGTIGRGMANAGPCVVVIDNASNKDGAPKQDGPRGGSAKYDAADWTYRVERVGKGFSGETAGSVNLVRTKDRITGAETDQVAGTFRFDGTDYHCEDAMKTVPGTLDDIPYGDTLDGLQAYVLGKIQPWHLDELFTAGTLATRLQTEVAAGHAVPMCAGKSESTITKRTNDLVSKGKSEGWLAAEANPDGRGWAYRYLPPRLPDEIQKSEVLDQLNQYPEQE